MNSKAITLISLIILVQASYAQTFFKTLWPQEQQSAYDMIRTHEGDFVIVGGRTLSNNSSDGFAAKISANGDTLWARTYGGAQDELFRSIEMMPDSTYLVGGKTNSYGIGSPGSTNWYVLNLDENGDTLWTYVHPWLCWDDLFHAIPTSDSGYVLSGYTFSGVTPSKRGTVVKLSANRTVEWTYYLPMNSSKGSYGFKVIEEDNGSFIIGALSDYFSAVRLTSTGAQQTIFQKQNQSYVIDMVKAPAKGYALLMINYSAGLWRSSVVRVDSSFSVVWQNHLDTVYSAYYSAQNEHERDMSLAVGPSGYLVTRYNWNGFYQEIKLCGLDTAGTVMWSASHGPVMTNYGRKGFYLPDGRIAFCGDRYTIPKLTFGIADPLGQITPVPSHAGITPSGSVQLCQDDSITLSTAIGTYFSYVWYHNNNSLQVNSPTVTVNTPGAYRVEIYDGLNSSQSSDTVTISHFQSPQINLGPDLTACYNHTLNFDAGSGFNAYIWSDGSTTQTINASYDGINAWDTISVQAVDSNTCNVRDTVVVYWDPCTGEDKPDYLPLLRLFPNPATSSVWMIPSSSGVLELYDIQGRLQLRSELLGGESQLVLVAQLSKGLYLWKYSTQDGLSSGKLMIQ